MNSRKPFFKSYYSYSFFMISFFSLFTFTVSKFFFSFRFYSQSSWKILICLFRKLCRSKSLEQCGHLNFFSLTWLSICLFKCEFLLNLQLHPSYEHTKFLFSIWCFSLKWRTAWDLAANVRLHFTQIKSLGVFAFFRIYLNIESDFFCT